MRLETFKDEESGGGTFLLSQAGVQNLSANHKNQDALGGGSEFLSGVITISVDPQTGAIIGATGTAVGNIIGAALKTAVKP